MPDYRKFHKRLMGSARVTALTYMERTVWEDMRLLVDDYGVLPFRPAKVRAEDLTLMVKETEGTVADAMEVVVRAGLFLDFMHQGERFVCDPTWQDFEQLKYTRSTHYPVPPPEVFGKLTRPTQELFRKFHEKFPKGSRRPGGLTHPNPNPIPDLNGHGGEPERGEATGSPRARIKFDVDAVAIVGVLDEDRARWSKLYPAVNLDHEFKKAADWLLNNPHKRRSNIAQFISNWLSRAQDDVARGRGPQRPAPSSPGRARYVPGR